MPMTNYLRKALADEAIGKVAFVMPTVYLALFTASPTEDGLFTNEVTGGSYARIELTSKLSAFDLATGISTSTAEVLFAQQTADWGTVSFVGVIDSLAAVSPTAHVLFYEGLASPRVVINGGRQVKFTAGQIRISQT